MRAIIAQIVKQDVKLIGKGSFTRVYRGTEDTSKVYLISASGVYDKETLCMASENDNNSHLPIVRRRGDFTYRGGDYYIFETVYTVKPTKENSLHAYNTAKILDSIWVNKFRSRFNYRRKHDMHSVCYDFIEYLRENNSVDESVIDALDTIYTWASHYDSNMFFEFPMRNLGVNDNGELVLRDVLFFIP